MWKSEIYGIYLLFLFYRIYFVIQNRKLSDFFRFFVLPRENVCWSMGHPSDLILCYWLCISRIFKNFYHIVCIHTCHKNRFKDPHSQLSVFLMICGCRSSTICPHKNINISHKSIQWPTLITSIMLIMFITF